MDDLKDRKSLVRIGNRKATLLLSSPHRLRCPCSRRVAGPPYFPRRMVSGTLLDVTGMYGRRDGRAIQDNVRKT